MPLDHLIYRHVNDAVLREPRTVITRRVVFIYALAITSNLVLALVLPKFDVWGTETTRIAASVASGGGFSSPFAEPTGPSAWIPPIYPYLLAGIFLLFGVNTGTSYWVAVGLNVIVHAFTCITLYRAAGEVFGPRVGYYSACALASFPFLFYPLVLLHVLGGYAGWGLFISPNILWYAHLSELAIVLLIWLTLHPPHGVAYGMAWGFAALLNPTVLALAPVFAGRLRVSRGWRYLGLAGLTAALCVTPWLIRNYKVFHHPVFIRDNLGVELRIGNQLGQDGRWSGNLHPNESYLELDRVVQMGELEYTRTCGREALDIIEAHPAEFFRNTVHRIGYWWIGNPMESKHLRKLKFAKYLPQVLFSFLAFWGIGRSVWNKNGNAWLFVGVLLFYPLVYYVTHTWQGFFYQYPTHPTMLALAASALVRETNLPPAITNCHTC